jgi:hypothetical protein
VTKRSWGAVGWLETEGSGGMGRVTRGDLRGARGARTSRYRPPRGAERALKSRLRAGVRAPIVAVKPGNSGGAKGCRKVETFCPNAVEKPRRECRRRLILLCHKLRRVFRVKRRAQHGHRGRVRAIATINIRCTVAIELGTCRWGRIGGAAGSVTTGNGRFREPPGATRS